MTRWWLRGCQRRSQETPTIRQQAALRDRSAGSLHETDRCGGNRRPEAPRVGRAATQVFFERPCATPTRPERAGGERRRPRRSRSGCHHQLVVATGPRVDGEVGAGDRVVLHAPGGTEPLQILECGISASPWSPSANHLSRSGPVAAATSPVARPTEVVRVLGPPGMQPCRLRFALRGPP